MCKHLLMNKSTEQTPFSEAGSSSAIKFLAILRTEMFITELTTARH